MEREKANDELNKEKEERKSNVEDSLSTFSPGKLKKLVSA
jgi:hypothetical protein